MRVILKLFSYLVNVCFLLKWCKVVLLIIMIFLYLRIVFLLGCVNWFVLWKKLKNFIVLFVYLGYWSILFY